MASDSGSSAIKPSGDFVGYGGIKHAEVEGRDEIELAYAIRSDHWRKGFATEIATAALQHAFDTMHLERIVAFTLPHNKASRGVMENCGFTYQRDIVHANLPHVLYILEARDFAAHRKSSNRCEAPHLFLILGAGSPLPRKCETREGFHIQ